jgi:hypothetical protein
VLALIMLIDATVLSPRLQRPITGGGKDLVRNPIPGRQPRDDACKEQDERGEADGLHAASMRSRVEHR